MIALDKDRVKGNERYLITSHEIFNLRKIAKELRERYPELRERIPELEQKEGLEERVCKIDTGKADKVFGREWMQATESVKLTVEDILRWEENGRQGGH